MDTQPDVHGRLDGYMNMVQDKINDNWTRMNFTFAKPPLVFCHLKQKYAKIYYVDDDGNGPQQSVHSFIDLATGDIIKGNWKAPIRSKGKLAVRGNVFADDFGADRVTEHGPMYLKPGRKAR